MSTAKTANRKQTTTNSSKDFKKPAFCKMCYDAGKNAKEYMSHYIRDMETGATTCPYLLSLVCGYCKKQEGHTSSRCPLLAKTQKKTAGKTETEAEAKTEPKAEPPIVRKKRFDERPKSPPSPLGRTVCTNRYENLRSLIDKDDEIEQAGIRKAEMAIAAVLKQHTDFPALSINTWQKKPAAVAATATPMSWKTHDQKVSTVSWEDYVKKINTEPRENPANYKYMSWEEYVDGSHLLGQIKPAHVQPAHVQPAHVASSATIPPPPVRAAPLRSEMPKEEEIVLVKNDWSVKPNSKWYEED
jgi:hypothetical protein